MRRMLATLLVSVLSFSLIVPMLAGGADTDLPACCRRNGVHHCAMMDMDAAVAQPSGPIAKAQPVRCAYFPKGGALLPHSDAALPAVSDGRYCVSRSGLTVQYRVSAGYGVSSGRSHQKRGPPVT